MADSAGKNSVPMDITDSVAPVTSTKTSIEQENPESSQMASGRGSTSAIATTGSSKTARDIPPENVSGPTATGSSRSKNPVSSRAQPTRNNKEQRAVINRVIAASARGDFYDVLNVSENASESDILRAYKQTAKAIHPDKSGDADADENMKSTRAAHSTFVRDCIDLSSVVMKAREILMDPGERRNHPKPKKDPKSSTFGESFAEGAWGDDIEEKLPFDLVELHEEAHHSILQLCSDPNDLSAIKDLEAINQRVKECNRINKRDENMGIIQSEKLQHFYLQALSFPDQPENYDRLRSNKAEAEDFMEQHGYPGSWASMMAPFEEPMEVDGEKNKEREKDISEPEEENEEIDDVQGFLTDNREPILAFSKVGHGHQFIVRTGTRDKPTYDLRSGSEIGFHIVYKYLNSDERFQLGQGKEYTKEDAKRYKEIIGVASKPLQTKTLYSGTRLPKAYTLARFDGEQEVWITRTNLRKVCGKNSADRQIRDWYRKVGMTPVDDISPRVVQRKVESKKSGSVESTDSRIDALTAQVEKLAEIVRKGN
ncbi:MAG: hypothetical protein Q9228_005665 [Teloschistes exilis]